MSVLPLDHHVGLWMSVDDGEPLLVGTARSMSDMPHLLRAVAENWHLRESDGVLHEDITVLGG